jgi:hypothetical protein
VAPQIFAATLQQSQRSGAELTASFQYLLSNFSGPVPSQWARLDFDPQRQEVYTLNQGVNDVRIYNPQGMEIFAFGTDGDLVSAADIASGDDGTIYVLARDFRNNGIQELNYRGEPESVITLNDLPQQFQGFSPYRMEYQDGHFYLLDSSALSIIICSADGTFQQGHALTSELNNIADEQDPEKQKTLGIEISGFGIGADASIYFTTPTLFSAFRINPDGSLDTFGTPGSGPGKFGVVSGIAADNQGNIYVADRLRSVVMIFDSKFIFLGEFGYRGDRAGDMLVPDDLVIDQAGNRVFVSQAAHKGVGVYRVIVKR